MDPAALVFVVAAYIVAVVGPLVLLPLALERAAGWPYNSVRSRVVAWAAFAGLLVVVSLASRVADAWSTGTWISMAVLVLAALGWDLYDMKTRRIPAGRHPTR